MIRIISNEKRYDQIFIRYLGKDYPIKYGSKIYIANAELTGIDLRFFTNGYNLDYSCDSVDIPNGLEDVFGKDRVNAWFDVEKDYTTELKRLFGTSRIAFGIVDRLNNVICPTTEPTGDSYNNLSDKPRINGVALYGDKSSDQLGLVSNEKYSEILTKIEDTLATSNATLNFVQTHCVEKSSTRLLFDSDRKLLDDIHSSLKVGDNNYVMDRSALDEILELYPTNTDMESTLAAYTPKTTYTQKLAEVDAKLAEVDNILSIHAENMKNYLSLASWETFSTAYVKTINDRHINKNNNVVLDAGDIPITAGDDDNVRGRLGELQAEINTNKNAITSLDTAGKANADSISNILNGTSTVGKAYRDSDGKLISSTYATNDNLNDKIDRVSRLIADLADRISILEAKLS